MSTVTRCINQLLDRSSVSAAQLHDATEAYRAELDRVNARLADASGLVRRGLRSEALAMIGGSPSLIDQANQLELPRIDELLDLMELYELPALAPVDTDAIELLGDAVVELQSIDGLLQRQRRLVLARAPLAWRLRTLRAIAAADPTNPHWIDDVVAHEKSRLEELAKDVQSAVQSEDQGAMESLRQELAAPWQTDPPENLRSAVDRKLNQLKLAEMQSELLQHAGAIQNAVDQFEEANCRTAADNYQSLRKQITQRFGPSAIPADTAAIAQPGLKYLAQQDAENARLAARAAAIAALANIMDQPGATVPQVESAYQKATAFEEPLPPELFHQFRATTGDLQTRGKRRFQLAVGSVAAAVLLAGGLMIAWQVRRNHNATVLGVTEQLEQLLAADSLDEAGKFINTLRKTQPKLASEPSISKFIARHDSMSRAEADRAERIDQRVAELEQVADEVLDPSLLSQLEDDAKTDDEKLRIQKHRMRYQNYINNRQSIQTEALVKTLKGYVEQISEYSTQSHDDSTPDVVTRAIAEIDEINEEIKSSVREYPWASSAAKNEGENQTRRLAALRIRLNEKVVSLHASNDATKAILAAKTLTSLQTRLEEFIEQLPTHSRAAAYRETLDAAEFWDSAESWNQHLKQLGEAFKAKFDSETVSLAQHSGKAIVEELSSLPFALPVSVDRCMALAAKRREILTQLDQHLDRSLFSQIMSVTQLDGKGERVYVYEEYYNTSREKFTLEDGQVLTPRVDIIQTSDGAVERKTLRGPLVIDQEPISTAVTMQAELENLRDSALADWDGVMLGWLAGLSKRDQLDSTLGEILTSQILERIMEGSASRKQLAKINLILAGRRGEWNDWYRAGARSIGPSDLLIQTIRPSLASVYRSRRLPSKEFAKLSQMRIVPVGVFDVFRNSNIKSSPGSLVIHYWRPVEQLPSGTLLAVRRDPKTPLQGEWIQLGQLQDGALTMNQTEIPLTAGQPVFLSAGLQSDVAFDLNSSRDTLAGSAK